MDDYSNMSNIERNSGTSRARGRISEVSDVHYLDIVSTYSLLYCDNSKMLSIEQAH
jgi:uncharacterized protein YlbG (UPF0298 family)